MDESTVEIERQCRKCGEHKPVGAFATYRRKDGSRAARYACYDCERRYQRKSIEESPYLRRLAERKALLERGYYPCPQCRTTKPVSEFAPVSNRGTGINGVCRECQGAYRRSPRSRALSRKRQQREDVRAWKREYYAQPEQMQKTRARSMMRSRDPDEAFRGKARASLRRAVKAGRIEQLPCEECGNPKTEGHHHNGYDRAHWLDVRWLCRSCHAAVHRLDAVGHLHASREGHPSDAAMQSVSHADTPPS